jgi:hypothetical protein
MEYRSRCKRNPQYSLRAFARDLGSDHATLSQILRNRRSLSPAMVRRIGSRLRLDPSLIADASAQQNAEVLLRLAQSPGFRAECRWIAVRTGLSIDTVNVAIHRLLRTGDLIMESSTCWKTTRPHYA